MNYMCLPKLIDYFANGFHAKKKMVSVLRKNSSCYFSKLDGQGGNERVNMKMSENEF